MRKTIRLTLILMLVTIFGAVAFIDRGRSQEGKGASPQSSPAVQQKGQADSKIQVASEFLMISGTDDCQVAANKPAAPLTPPFAKAPNGMTNKSASVVKPGTAPNALIGAVGPPGKMVLPFQQKMAGPFKHVKTTAAQAARRRRSTPKQSSNKTRKSRTRKTPGGSNSPSGYYKVRRNDSLWKIAARFCRHRHQVPALMKLIKAANPTLRGRWNRLQVNETLKIPALPPVKLAQAKKVSRKLTQRGSYSRHVIYRRKTRSTRRSHSNSRRKLIHIVRRGESLVSIARKLLGRGSRWIEIYDTNKELLLNDPHHLKPGMSLVIYRRNFR